MISDKKQNGFGMETSNNTNKMENNQKNSFRNYRTTARYGHYYMCAVFLIIMLYSQQLICEANNANGAIAEDYRRRAHMNARLSATKSKAAFKTKRYKCIEIIDQDKDITHEHDTDASNNSNNSNDWSEEFDVNKNKIRNRYDQIDQLSTSPSSQRRIKVNINKINDSHDHNSNNNNNINPNINIKNKSLSRHRRPSTSKYNQPLSKYRIYTSRTLEPKNNDEHIQKSNNDINNVRYNNNYNTYDKTTKNNNPPLILSPQHCAKVKLYAGIYRVGKITDWVKQNCSLAKLFLPKATCEEINTLVASCHL